MTEGSKAERKAAAWLLTAGEQLDPAEAVACWCGKTFGRKVGTAKNEPEA